MTGLCCLVYYISILEHNKSLSLTLLLYIYCDQTAHGTTVHELESSHTSESGGARRHHG